MFQDALQSRAHSGDQTAFRDIYNRYSREVYAVSYTALGSADSARAVVRQVFLQLYRELMRSEDDLDLAARLSSLTNDEIRIMRIAAGELDPDALLVQYTVASQPAVDTSHTMDRIRAHIQQEQPAAKEARTVFSEEADPEEVIFEEVSFEETVAGSAADQTEFELFEIPEEPQAEPETAEVPDASAPADTQQESPAVPPAEEAPKKSSRSGAAIAGILLVLLLIIFAWLIVGILMDLAILPFYDLGYSLFNEYVFDFFRLP